MTSLSVRICQIQVAEGSSPAALSSNRGRILSELDAASEDIVVFPEAALSGFPYRHLEAAAEAGQQLLSEIRYPGVCVIPLILNDGAGFVNRTSVLENGRVLAVYDKIHLIGVLGEDRFLRAGTHVSRFSRGPFGFGLATCYDLRFPELFRCLIAQDVQAFILPALWPRARQQHLHALARARAIENQAWVIAANGASGGALDSCGQSAVFSPRGEIMAQAEARADSIVARLELDDVLSWRREFPALADRKSGFESEAFAGIDEKKLT